jgi:hypothetical protein
MNLQHPVEPETAKVFEDIAAERRRQDRKFGEQEHDIPVWMLILSEEVGEASSEGLALYFGYSPDPAKTGEDFRAEMVQVAAVAVAAIENYDRNQFTP